MKNKLLVLSLAGLLAASPALAGEGVFGIDYGRTKISDVDVDGGGAGVYGGYRFNETFAVEFGYRRLLHKVFMTNPGAVDLKGTTLQASALAYLPVGADFSLFGRLGYGRLKAEGSTAGVRVSDSEGKALFGVGAEYAFNKNTAFRLEWQKPASDTTTWSLGLKLSF